MYLVTVVKDKYYSECGVEVVGLFTTEEKAYIAKEKVTNWLEAEEYDDYEVFVHKYDESNLDFVMWYELEEKL